jgi:molecular chaperone DnaK (HSP70)
MFAKRSMGEDATFRLARQGVLRPEQVSAHLLRYLKKMAEERLGEPVDEAVITVPAYFSIPAKQMTEKAGEMAGLKVAQIAQEPVAAALMYCASDFRDPLRIMTYDLGGGTFDIAILEKRDGAISTNSIRAFDGDRFLGGYDFDKSLALFIIDQLNARGYDLDPSDKVSFAKLMVYAEHAKRVLSERESYEFFEHQSGITDRSGKPVVIELGITRSKFEAMISKQINDTIELCRRAMNEKANPPIRPDQIDEIIMVGGSSRIPLVSRRLEAEFGKKPKLIEPDLCVALGAAIIAGTKPKMFGCLKLDPIPAETDLPTITVTGRVMPNVQVKVVEKCAVTLRSLDGAYVRSRSTGSEGGFVFDSVNLAPDERTDFALTVMSPSGEELASHRFSVLQAEAAKGGGVIEAVTNVLSRPIGIQTVESVQTVAPERTPLPFEVSRRAKTTDTSGQIRIPIFDGNNGVGEIRVEDIPNTVHVGSTVEITLSIQENYQIRGRAYIPSVGRETTVVIDIPIPPRKSIEELKRDFSAAAARAKDAQAGAGRGVLFGDAKAKRLEDRLRDCEEMLRSRDPEPAKIQDCLDEVNSLVRAISEGWKPDPPRAIFDQKLGETQTMLSAVIKQKPKVAQDGYNRQLEAIRSEAEKAYNAQNGPVWKDSYNQLVNLHGRLRGLIEDAPSQVPPNPEAIVVELGRELAALESWAKSQGRYMKFKDRFEDLESSLQRIEPKAFDAMSQIRDWYFTRFSDLRKRLDAPESEMGLVSLEGA